jgi:acetolactate synthase small subunit
LKPENNFATLNLNIKTLNIKKMENKTFTISVYSENNVGLLNRISGIFLKRHINILSLNVSESEIENVSRFIIVVNTTENGYKISWDK